MKKKRVPISKEKEGEMTRERRQSKKEGSKANRKEASENKLKTPVGPEPYLTQKW